MARWSPEFTAARCGGFGNSSEGGEEEA
ncbi:hypothetical protein A2U01_0101319, partial [Trifolium medium]|nr:hypothetical protein [Trifolium medium]